MYKSPEFIIPLYMLGGVIIHEIDPMEGLEVGKD